MTDFASFVSTPAGGPPDAQAVRDASACLDRFTAAFNACDVAGMDAELHFPHVMFSGAERLDWPAPGQHPADFFDRLQSSGWVRTAYVAKDAVLVAADKVHFVVTYTRHGAGGAVLSTHRNLWIAMCVAGRWGIVLRSY